MKEMSQIRVGSWNIRKCVGLDRRRDPDRVLRGIAAMGADIVALQEADRRLGARPATLDARAIEAATGLSAVDIDTTAPSLGWHGNALLLGRGIEAQAVERITLPGLEPRGALLVETQGRAHFRVVATHLGLTRSARRAQLAALRDLLAGRDARPTVILGDFNEWRADRGLEPLAGAFEIVTPGKTYHAARPALALDRIAHCDRLAVKTGGVLQNEDTARASDHLPIWAELGLAPQAKASGLASRAM